MFIEIIRPEEFEKVRNTDLDTFSKLSLLSEMSRLNTLSCVKKAGSGHLVSSLSAMDIVSYFYYYKLNTIDVGFDNENRDIYFSSKGHDVPGLYSVLYSLGIIPEDKFFKLRKIDGLDGHPDIKMPGIEANTGSLGMGISKGKGILFAKQYKGRKGKVIVLTGDGEFHEGQNFEALQSTVSLKLNELVVIMDHNKLQSDRKVEEINDLGDIETKIKSFGWHVERFDGHDFKELERVFNKIDEIKDKPKFLIADTIKGKGVSFMEHPKALEDGKGIYAWHSGAPNDVYYEKAREELKEKINLLANKLNIKQPEYISIELEKSVSGVSDEYVSKIYGKTLVKLAEEDKDFIILDADLSADCKVDEFEKKYPERFVEVGIAEQDMVSMAGGLALQGLTPVVNSFASFLASRANEQIYNNLTEGGKIVYACHYAGIVPAGPGKSHQSLRDASLFGAFPNCDIIMPSNAYEMKKATEYAVLEAKDSVMLRIIIGPSPRKIDFPSEYKFEKGKGCIIGKAKENIIFCYGPTMLNEALEAQEILKKENIDITVVNFPWLNRFDINWLEDTLINCNKLFILEDHMEFGGLADNLIPVLIKSSKLKKMDIEKLGFVEYPKYGTPKEVLDYHGLSGEKIADRIKEQL
ncbi:MAG: 1-deoxy-D-xylulose-5-phosphate synthase [Candidatus Muiribacterium halophilum]|uniref:1-deoxy-D-xylulose-5-phosphate synthase n=1 Tax=Muiribacterium halophilum TaxID=2053465 RepID=A0A2N5ZA02_MUIH1|nr:MAG: 1-deoxy-D-xylulose-5-phosphate synthase [Candidatus Muirbacterium halophilum]